MDPSPERPSSDIHLLSPKEALKAESHGLRGRIVEELAEPTDRFSDATAQLLRHHGIYQQDDRDRRRHLGSHTARTARVYSLMARVAVPGGRLSSEQLLAQLDIGDEFGNGALRITTRQALEIYGIAKRNIREVVRRVNGSGLSTLGASGDAARNVMCCPAPYWGDPVHGQMQWLAHRLADELRPHVPAYREIWLDGAGSAQADGTDNDRLYGRAYLPHKLKIAVGLPGDNCVGVYSQDIGLLAMCEDFRIVGYNVFVGGGMGMTPGNEQTFAAMARHMALVGPEQVIDVVKAVLAVFRDHGDRSNRKRARLKYLLADWGMEKFKNRVEAVLGYPLAALHSGEVWDIDDHLGWHEQGDGRWFFGVYVETGRLVDRHGLRLKSALREVCRKYQPQIGLTAGQCVLLGDIRWEDRPGVDDLLRRHEVRSVYEISAVRRWSAACVSMPTCPLAVTESERVLPGLVDQLEAELVRLDLTDVVFTLRMTGCPNGCSRPYNAEVGLVGRTAGRYAIYLGGRRLGNRLGVLYRDGVPLERIVATLIPVLLYFRHNRNSGESFGDFCARKGPEELLKNAQSEPAA
ncbi:MAG: NADPH-dependent assimilatory sulfite reductase hemoprotein subunit [Thermoguttaceae bacterium]|jgi:sulfite reductase (ferredoxin)